MESKSSEKLPPTLGSYVKLNLGVFAFIAATTWLMAMILGSARGLVLFSLILAGGFFSVSLFDYLWLRIRK